MIVVPAQLTLALRGQWNARDQPRKPEPERTRLLERALMATTARIERRPTPRAPGGEGTDVLPATGTAIRVGHGPIEAQPTTEVAVQTRPAWHGSGMPRSPDAERELADAREALACGALGPAADHAWAGAAVAASIGDEDSLSALLELVGTLAREDQRARARRRRAAPCLPHGGAGGREAGHAPAERVRAADDPRAAPALTRVGTRGDVVSQSSRPSRMKRTNSTSFGVSSGGQRESSICDRRCSLTDVAVNWRRKYLTPRISLSATRPECSPIVNRA